MGYEDALQMVQNRRYCISPNGGFLAQIKVCDSQAYGILVPRQTNVWSAGI